MVVIKSKDKPKSHYEMAGIGVINTPKEYCLKQILNFEELQKVSKHFKKVVHQPKLKRVYMVMEAYGYEARLLIKYTVKSQDNKSVFHWNVVWGGFQGMIGDIELTSLKPDKTEAVLTSTFDDQEVPLPSIFKSFLLEIIVQRVASSMRSHIEERYKKETKK